MYVASLISQNSARSGSSDARPRTLTLPVNRSRVLDMPPYANDEQRRPRISRIMYLDTSHEAMKKRQDRHAFARLYVSQDSALASTRYASQSTLHSVPRPSYLWFHTDMTTRVVECASTRFWGRSDQKDTTVAPAAPTRLTFRHLNSIWRIAISLAYALRSRFPAS